MNFGVLGPIDVRDDGREVRLGGPKQRAVLAILLLHANEVVSRDRLIDGLWGERPPASAEHTLDDYVSRLRKIAGNGRLARRPPGYRLTVASGELDLERFELLVRAGRDALARGDASTAEVTLRRALALWRGPALADVLGEPFAGVEHARLEERRVAAVEARIDAELALGRSAELVDELESLVREHPFRERLIGQLMLALYRSGRQADALDTARSTRHRLAEELGLEPGPSLQQLEAAILNHDPSIAAPKEATPGESERAGWSRRERSRPTGRLALAAAAAVVAIFVVSLIAGLARPSPALRATANSIGVVDPRANALAAVVKTGGRPGGIAAGLGAVWETDTADGLLLEIDPQRRNVERIPVGHGPTAVTTGDGQVWVVNQIDRNVSEINPRSLTEVGSFQVGNGASVATFANGSLWVANALDDTVTRINPDTGATVTIPLVGTPAGIAGGPEGVWVTIGSIGQLLLIDPHTNLTTQAVGIGNGPSGVAAGGGAVWVANNPDGTVSRFDPASGTVRKINVGNAPAGVAYGAGTVWVADSRDGTLARIDPRSGSVRRVQVGSEPTLLAVGGGQVWTAALPAPRTHRGGDLRVVEGPPFLSVGSGVDPAVFGGADQWQILSLTNDGLVTYRHVDGLAASTLVPDLATGLPTPTNDGRTYTFHVRSGIRYSTGALVAPADFRRAIERVFKLGDRYAQSFFTRIVGAKRCVQAPQQCNLSRGIATDESTGTVTFNLTAPDPDFLLKLAFPFADALPPGTPDRPIEPSHLPATGAYRTQAITRSRALSPAGIPLAFATWTLVRNTRFHPWSADAQPDGYPDRIVISQTADPRTAVDGVKRGSVDVVLGPPTGTLRDLAVHYSNRLHSAPLAATFALAMNTRAAPFDHLGVRQALNYAINRNRILSFAGGPLAAQPTCQILPPTLPGYEPYCPYTSQPNPGGSWSAPDLAKAQQLVGHSHTRGMSVTVWVPPPDATNPTEKIGRYLVSLLDQLGYHGSLKIATSDTTPLADSRAHRQIGWFTWYSDYPAPAGFIAPLFTCGSFIPHSPSNPNIAEYCDPTLDQQIQRANATKTAAPGIANKLWSRIDEQLTDNAAWIPLYNPHIPAALSARVGNYQYHPFWRLMLDQLWVR